MKPITVLLAEDHEMIRAGLRLLLEADANLKVVGEAKNGRQAVQLTRKLRPAVVLMDISMPLLNGLDATRIILTTLPHTRIIMLSANADPAYVERAIELGAAGYLVKQSSSAILARAIREAQKGRSFFGPALAKRLRAPQVSLPARRGGPRTWKI